MKTSILLVLLPLLSAALALPTSMSNGIGASSDLENHVVTARDTHYSNRKRAEGNGKSTTTSEPATGDSKETKQKETDSTTPATSQDNPGTASEAAGGHKAGPKSTCILRKLPNNKLKVKVIFIMHGTNHEEEAKVVEGALPETVKHLFKFKKSPTQESSSSTATVDTEVGKELVKMFVTKFHTMSTSVF